MKRTIVAAIFIALGIFGAAAGTATAASAASHPAPATFYHG